MTISEQDLRDFHDGFDLRHLGIWDESIVRQDEQG